MQTENFNAQCYALLRCVPKGRLTTYKELAHAMQTKAYRAVGNAMANNPDIPKTPCHRVVNSDGRIGGYAHKPEKKVKMLKEEGIEIKGDKVQNLNSVLMSAEEIVGSFVKKN